MSEEQHTLSSSNIEALIAVSEKMLDDLWNKIYAPMGKDRACFNRDTREFQEILAKTKGEA